MVPGEVYAITIELFPIGNLFVAGPPAAARHREQQLPAFRRQSRIPGSPKGRWNIRASRDNRVFVDRERPSHLVLPVIP